MCKLYQKFIYLFSLRMTVTADKSRVGYLNEIIQCLDSHDLHFTLWINVMHSLILVPIQLERNKIIQNKNKPITTISPEIMWFSCGHDSFIKSTKCFLQCHNLCVDVTISRTHHVSFKIKILNWLVIFRSFMFRQWCVSIIAWTKLNTG